MAAFNGTLNQNAIYAALYNMIINQVVLSPDVYSGYGKLRNIFSKGAGSYGDTELYYSTDLRNVEPWTADSEAANLTNIQRATPTPEKIVCNVKKMIWVTIDSFLSRQAFGDEGSFSAFNSVVVGTLNDTKTVYLDKYINVGVGITETATGKQTQTMAAAGTAATIATKIANIFADVKDGNTQFNDNGHLRAYNPEDFVIVWNSEYANILQREQLPAIFHDTKVFGDDAFAYQLPARYFGTLRASGTTAAGDCAVDAIKISNTYYMPGDVVPTGTAYTANAYYTPNAKVICKIVHKDAFKFLSQYETMTEFFNARSLTTNKYLIMVLSNNLDSRIKDYPVITLKDA